MPRVLSFGASYRRFTRGLTVDGYKSRVNIVPVNSAGSERALGFDSSESEGVVPVVCTCRYLRREIRKEKGEEGRSHILGRASLYVCMCVCFQKAYGYSGISYPVQVSVRVSISIHFLASLVLQSWLTPLRTSRVLLRELRTTVSRLR